MSSPEKPGVSLAYPTVAIRLTNQKKSSAALLVSSTTSKTLQITVKERAEAKAPGPMKLGKTLMSLSSDDVVNLETEVERYERQTRTGNGEKRMESTNDREMVVNCFGNLTSSSDEAEAIGGGPYGEELYYLTFMPATSKAADVKFLRFTIDASIPGTEGGSPASDEPVASEAKPSSAAVDTFTQFKNDLIKRVYPRGPRSIVAFVSPVSGQGKGEKMWQDKCYPILRCSRHNITTVITTHKGHAEERAFSDELFDHSLYVAVGGDGMAHEVVNGIMRRRSERPDSVPANFMVGLVAAGSGCAIAHTLRVIDPIAAAMALVHCRQAPLDLMRSRFLDTTKYEKVDRKAKDKKARAEEREVEVKAAHHPERYGFLSCSFAITNELDRGSEKYRWMGNARFTFAAVKILAGTIPTYRASVRYVPWVDPSEASPLKDRKLEKVTHECPTPTFPECTFRDGCPHCEVGDPSGEAVDIPEDAWKTLEEEQFAFLMVCNLPWIARDSKPAPYAHACDGAMDLVYVPPEKQKDGSYAVPRSRFVKVFLQMEDGTHVPNPEYRYVKAKAIEILPRDGITMMDGEAVPTDEEDLAGMRISVINRAVTFCGGK